MREQQAKDLFNYMKIDNIIDKDNPRVSSDI